MLSDLKLLTKIVVPTYPTKVHILRLYSPKTLLVQSPNMCLRLLTKNVAPTYPIKVIIFRLYSPKMLVIRSL